MAIVYAKTKKAKYAARTNYFNKIHISVPADRIVTGWLDMCYTMHYPELLSSLKYYEIICHYKVTNRDKIKAFCICWNLGLDYPLGSIGSVPMIYEEIVAYETENMTCDFK